MILPILFFASGAGIAVLVYNKLREMQTKRTPMLLRVISLGDARMKELSHRSAHFYADTKEEFNFFLKKQLPLRTKNTWNKFLALAEEKLKILGTDLRRKLFRKTSGLSEYFQSIADESADQTEDQGNSQDFQNEENTLE